MISAAHAPVRRRGRSRRRRHVGGPRRSRRAPSLSRLAGVVRRGAGFPQDHRLFAGHLPPDRARLRELLGGHDCVVVVGAPVLRQYGYDDGPLVPEGTSVIVVSDDPAEVHRSPADLALLAPPASVCAALTALLEPRDTALPEPMPAARATASTTGRAAARRARLAALAERLPADAILVEECPPTDPSCTPACRRGGRSAS